MEFKKEYEAARSAAENALSRLFTGEGLEEAMRYSLMAGGKRVRPVLAIKLCEAAGGTAEEAIGAATALELIHTYSLIHDDLPAMDNDDLRRGRPTNHKVFGECTAILAGDALQAAAFRVLAEAGARFKRPGAAIEALRALAEAAGERGMCLGQFGDTTVPENERTAEALSEINDKKTGALLRAAAVLGVLSAMGYRDVPESCLAAAAEYAENLGLAFQIRDDILDSTGSEAALGKPIGSDEENGKATFVTLLGIEKAEKLAEEYTEKAKKALKKAQWPGKTDFLTELADELQKREK